MRSIRAEEKAVSMWLSGRELPNRREVLALVRQALEDNGFAPWEDTEAECFAAGEELLVIARPAERRQAFFLPSVEGLLSLASAFPEADGAVYAAEDGYIWTLPASQIRWGMYEFGGPVRLHPLWEVHAREHGRCIIAERAGQVLLQAFRQD